MKIKTSAVFALLCGVTLAMSDEHEEKAVQSGRFQYELIKRDSQMPNFGQCWTKSLLSLEQGCKQMTDDLQSRLALKFANCFLAQAGQKTYPCLESQAISECLRGIDSNAFTAYSNFFTVRTSILRCYSCTLDQIFFIAYPQYVPVFATANMASRNGGSYLWLDSNFNTGG